MEFIPIIVAFASALVGVVGNTWNSDQVGIRKVTVTGWVVASLAVISLIYGIQVLQKKNEEIIEVSKIREVAHAQISDGVGFIVRHITDGELRKQNSITETLIKLKEKEYQKKIGETRLTQYRGMGGVVFDGPLGGFSNPYELYDANISHGKSLLDDSLIKYAQFLKPKTIIQVNEVLNDPFFLNNYTFARHKEYFDQGLQDEENGADKSPWNYLGLYYFNAVYWGSGKREGSNEEFNKFISKIERLALSVELSSE